MQRAKPILMFAISAGLLGLTNLTNASNWSPLNTLQNDPVIKDHPYREIQKPLYEKLETYTSAITWEQFVEDGWLERSPDKGEIGIVKIQGEWSGLYKISLGGLAWEAKWKENPTEQMLPIMMRLRKAGWQDWTAEYYGECPFDRNSKDGKLYCGKTLVLIKCIVFFENGINDDGVRCPPGKLNN